MGMIVLTFTEGAATKPFENSIDQEVHKSLAHFEKELQKLRTGRAHTSMIEDIKVLAYGTSMSLKDLAAISAPEPQLLVVQPWDKGLIGDIERAISLSDLGVTPLTDGNLIRVPLPKMSSARREELTKVLAKRLEDCRVAIRAIRKDIHNLIRESEKGKKISEDYSKRLQTILQKNVDAAVEKAEHMAQKKESEIKAL
jgi:ribosome recycling factor